MTPNAMLVHPVEVEVRNGDLHFAVPVEHAGGVDRLEAVVRGVTVPPLVPGDAAMAAALLAAMSRKQPLRMSDPVSPSLLAGIAAFQGVFHGWYPDHAVVPVEAPVLEREYPRAPGSAHFFSGGVDSFHSILKHRESIDRLIYADGADVRSLEEPLRSEIRRKLTEAAEELGLPLITVETNVGVWSALFGSFGDRFVGSRLAFVSHLLSGVCGEAWVASSSSASLIKFPTHPILDPLWSSGAMAIRHPLPPVPRVVKVREVAAAEFPLRYLRVCMGGRAYNCGKCAKCGRTMIALFLVGALDRCPVFPQEFDFDQALAHIVAKNTGELGFMAEMAEFARETGADPAMVAKLQAAERAMRSERVWDDLGKLGGEFASEARWGQLDKSTRRELFRQLARKNPGWLAKEAASLPGPLREAVLDALWKTDRTGVLARCRKLWLDRWRSRLHSRLQNGGGDS